MKRLLQSLGVLSGDLPREKVLIGVLHSDQRELDTVLETVDQYNPASVGLELPIDYERLMGAGIVVTYFVPLAKALKERGIEVVALECPDLRAYTQGLDIARESRGNLDFLEMKLSRWKGRVVTLNAGSAPEIVEEQVVVHYKIERYRQAASIVRLSEDFNEAAYQELFEQNEILRNGFMKERIDTEDPDMIVIGDGHARKLAAQLPGYQYIKTEEVERFS